MGELPLHATKRVLSCCTAPGAVRFGSNGNGTSSHANEVGTVGGKVRPGSKTEAFIKATKVPVHVPLSGRLMEFDAAGKCTAGC